MKSEAPSEAILGAREIIPLAIGVVVYGLA